jgi:putative ABC transport system permease protein
MLRDMILVLFAAVSFVLLITCANVANLLLVRAWARQREFAVRAAMGASRKRLMGQVLTESALLSLLGAIGGIGVAHLTLRAIERSPLGQVIPGAHLQPAVLAWCVGIGLLTSLAFGIAPARFAAEGRMTDALKSGVRSVSEGINARRFRTALVALEIALSVVLLASAGLLVRTLVAMQRADVGLDTRDLISFDIRFPQKNFSPEARRAAITTISSELRAVPGVRDVTLALMPPPRFAIGLGGLQFEDRPITTTDSLAAIGVNDVEPAYFSHVGLRVVSGRVFEGDSPLQTGDIAPAEIMVNLRFARRFWPGSSAIGRRIKYGALGSSTIVGVVEDVDIPGVSDRARSLQLYLPIPAAPLRASVVLRAAIPAHRLDSLIRVDVNDVAPGTTVGAPVIAADVLANGREAQHSLLILLGTFAAVALLLAAVGLHAVVAFSVSQRTREIGVRVALGAEMRDVVRLVLRQGLSVALAGVVVGSVGALATTRVLSSFLYDVTPADPVTIGCVGALLLIVAALASIPPAWRAARVDPIEALRAE